MIHQCLKFCYCIRSPSVPAIFSFYNENLLILQTYSHWFTRYSSLQHRRLLQFFTDWFYVCSVFVILEYIGKTSCFFLETIFWKYHVKEFIVFLLNVNPFVDKPKNNSISIEVFHTFSLSVQIILFKTLLLVTEILYFLNYILKQCETSLYWKKLLCSTISLIIYPFFITEIQMWNRVWKKP